MLKLQFTLAFVFLGIAFLVTPARATLDQSETSITNDVTHMKITKRRQLTLSGVKNSTHMHELSIDANTVRQYADISGHIFAITWNGVTQPDLSVLLGDHYSSYLDQTKVRALARGGRGPRRIQTSSGAVIKTSGHMGSLRGIAYMPDQLPSDVNPDDLQ